jgi:hypothetical protein
MTLYILYTVAAKLKHLRKYSKSRKLKSIEQRVGSGLQLATPDIHYFTQTFKDAPTKANHYCRTSCGPRPR